MIGGRTTLLSPPVQFYRLSGGIKLFVDVEGKCKIVGLFPGLEANFRLNGRQIGARLFDYKNLRVLARNKCFQEEELRDDFSANLALRAIGPDGKCLAFSQDIYWSGVANVWPAPGSEDTKLRCLMEPEVGYGATEIYARVQA